MKEKDFINKVHKKLPKEVYKWKINDPYHGGVPDAFYSGPAGFCFVEYKYKPKLPKKGASKINFGLSSQQNLWLNKQKDFGVPVFVIAGCEDRLVCLQTNFDECNAFTRDTFLGESMHFNDFIKLLNEHCLHGIG